MHEKKSVSHGKRTENGFEWQLASSPSLLKKNDGWNVSSDSASIPYTTLTNWEGATSRHWLWKNRGSQIQPNPIQSNGWISKVVGYYCFEYVYVLRPHDVHFFLLKKTLEDAGGLAFSIIKKIRLKPYHPCF